MPKRCKQCRDRKKNKKVSSAAGIGTSGAIGFGNVTEPGKNSGSGRKNGDSGSYGYNSAGQNGGKKSNWLIILAAIAVVAVAVILIFVNANKANDSDAVASTNTVSTAGINETVQMSDQGSTEVEAVEETDAVSDAETEDGEDTENSDGDASADDDMSAGDDMSVGDDMSAGSADSEVPAGTADDSGKESDTTVSEPVSTATSYRFRNNKLLTQHYEKHGIEMGFNSAADYEAAASAVINNPNALNKIEAEDGDYVYYVEATNEFVVLSTDGYIRTYFLPSGGKAYYDRQ